MTYLKSAVTCAKGFRAVFTSSASTDLHATACFFMAMQDKGIQPADLQSYIKMGKLCDSGQPWAEIERIAATFISAKSATEAA